MKTALVSVEKRAQEWMGGFDTGLSSKCIWRTMLGWDEPSRWGGSHPLDPSDFGRCHRLLLLIPEWRPRLGEMAKHGKVWAALVKRWDEIEALYLEELDSGVAPKCYALIKDIEDSAP